MNKNETLHKALLATAAVALIVMAFTGGVVLRRVAGDRTVSII